MMKTAVAWRAAYATDPGLERGVNEDRVLVDESRGIFLVVDGMGGRAAGETAAETAVRSISEQFTGAGADVEQRIRLAITQANNRIYELAQSDQTYSGMACVLTLVALEDQQVTVGHVGDTRLYLIWNGNVRKITSDHSPVGEQEQQGELTEEQAMRHPRRNEVFRDVGSRLHNPDDPNFIEVRQFPFRPDAAMLLCSDGLTDVLTSSQIMTIVEQYDGNPDSVARELVRAANQAGGLDNISVVFIAGPEFLGSRSNTLVDMRPRHAATRASRTNVPWRRMALSVF
ncbi:MAG: serine/threonine-protein phosphatase, partial [Acidobacteriaceae bacterium]|nr:serine/threonine-protein phosphatase [Acidobacteriaceae bacterium]